MKNIAIIITKLNGGGAERCASNLSIELSKKYNVKLIVFDATNITYPYGGELINLNISNSDGIFNKAINIFKRVKKAREIKKKNKIECSISLLDGPNIVNVLSSCGENTIVSVRNMLSHEPMSALRKKLVRFTSIHSDTTVALSEMVKYDLINYFNIPKEKITTIYNHCDALLLKKLCEDHPTGINTDPNMVNYVTMGRLNKQKGQWHLIRAFQSVVKEIPNAHLYIMGEGELEQQLKNLVCDLHLESYITLTGYISNPHGIYSQCDIFVFSSLFEGLGNVLLEALAFNMPIISSDCKAGPREILAPHTDFQIKASGIEFAEYGILVPVCDGNHFNASDPLTKEEEYLAKAMVCLSDNPEVKNNYIKKASNRVRDFDKQHIMNKWIDIIEGREENAD